MRSIKFGTVLSICAFLIPWLGLQVKGLDFGWISAAAGWVYFVGFIVMPTALFFGICFILVGAALVAWKWYKS